MPSSNQRSTSTTNRPFTIVLTDNSELLRHTHAFQFPVNYNNFFPQITHQRQAINPVQNGANNNNDDIPEQLLNNLLGLELMDSWNRPFIYGQPTTAITQSRYFLITMTNYPNVLLRTQQYQEPPIQQYIQQYRGAIFIPNTSIRIGIDGSEHYEGFLYTILRFELEESIRTYLQRTQRLYPINLVFDLSNINQQR
ncbi:unnamed protein product [Rotaria magnacalcarata]|uniref:Uncharacterized protein n=1 Tax=Rotaria magnacalcarata TaxID=392030 RepID=A0A8S2X6Q0_9BILA|nr:unnamed protein product [Rotaria magnacalcarata]